MGLESFYLTPQFCQDIVWGMSPEAMARAEIWAEERERMLEEKKCMLRTHPGFALRERERRTQPSCCECDCHVEEDPDY